MEFKPRASRRNGRSKRVAWAARGVSAVAGTMIAGLLVATPAVAQSADDPTPPKAGNSSTPAKKPAKAKGLGGHGHKQQRIVRAVVEDDGTLVRGQSYGAASAERLATGIYQVCFNARITNGTYNATIGLPGNEGEPPAGEINVVGRFATNNCLYIQTYNSAGTHTDRGFHVTVAYTAHRH